MGRERKRAVRRGEGRWWACKISEAGLSRCILLLNLCSKERWSDKRRGKINTPILAMGVYTYFIVSSKPILRETERCPERRHVGNSAEYMPTGHNRRFSHGQGYTYYF